MDFAAILAWLKKLFAVPNIHDEPAVRAWIEKYLGFMDMLTGPIPGELDDKTVDLLKAVTASDDTWAEFYAVLLEIAGGADLPMASPRAAALQAKLGARFDWDLILQIIRLLLELFSK